VLSFFASLFFFLWLPSSLPSCWDRIALSQIERTGQAGKGLAVLGIVLGSSGWSRGSWSSSWS
jgi:hypothetical protein